MSTGTAPDWVAVAWYTLEKQGKKVFETKGCKSCHTIKGVAELTQRSRTTGPDLTHVGSRTTLGAVTMPNTKDNLSKWIHQPFDFKGGALMVTMSAGIYEEENRISEDEADALAAYLYRLK